MFFPFTLPIALVFAVMCFSCIASMIILLAICATTIPALGYPEVELFAIEHGKFKALWALRDAVSRCLRVNKLALVVFLLVVVATVFALFVGSGTHPVHLALGAICSVMTVWNAIRMRMVEKGFERTFGFSTTRATELYHRPSRG